MKRIVPILLIAMMATVGCSKKALIAQKDAEIASLQSDVTELKGQVGELQASLDQQQKMNAQLNTDLADLREEKRILIDEKESLTHITLDGAATFGTAQADLTGEAKEVLDRVWSVLADYPDRRILIEGHTDSRPVAMTYREKFASNWELSSARAHSVLHYLQYTHNADPKRLAAVGYGASEPVADDSTPEGRAQNRRVVITVGSAMDVEARISRR
jgi:chemotaxis protein MotB